MANWTTNNQPEWASETTTANTPLYARWMTATASTSRASNETRTSNEKIFNNGRDYGRRHWRCCTPRGKCTIISRECTSKGVYIESESEHLEEKVKSTTTTTDPEEESVPASVVAAYSRVHAQDKQRKGTTKSDTVARLLIQE